MDTNKNAHTNTHGTCWLLFYVDRKVRQWKESWTLRKNTWYLIKTPTCPGDGSKYSPFILFDFSKKPSLLPLSPFEELFNEVLLFPLNYTVAACMSHMRSPMYEGTHPQALSWAPECVSRLRIDSLSESQDPHQASSGSHGGSLSDETLAFTCASHTWLSLNFLWRGKERLKKKGSRVLHLAVYKRLLSSLWPPSQFHG